MTQDNERQRLQDNTDGKPGAHWKRWGPYLAERAWGTVREDYSANGTAWDYLPHDHARSKAYRWGEDGLLGICDDRQKMCFALCLWNGQDAILKERAFGLSGSEGNHGEDVKEYYFYTDNTPTHSYMKALYKYPQGPFPYQDLVDTNRARSRHDPEYELLDTNAFGDNRYWDVQIEYAKASPDDICIVVTATNRGPDAATLHLLPTLWLRNTWAWGYDSAQGILTAGNAGPDGGAAIDASHPDLGQWELVCEGSPDLLFTENETNAVRLYGAPHNPAPHVKDGFHEYVIEGVQGAVNGAKTGTKAAAHYTLTVQSGQSACVRMRLTEEQNQAEPFGADFDALVQARKAEADAFYQAIGRPDLSEDVRNVMRQAFAGLLWSKQFYKYDVTTWLDGDPAQPPPPPERKTGRNSEWRHFNASDIISMPDTWEYPWFAAWDLAFHCIALAVVDADFAKEQMLLLDKVWYQHPNGQLPAYEWAFGDINPPVNAWGGMRVFQIERRLRGGNGDTEFLERKFQKMLLSWTWWVNRKDMEGKNVFQGGFLGLDNIGIFDRSQPLPTGGYLEQSDGTSWMAMFGLNMLNMALELAKHEPSYEDMAIKFFEHFVYIAHAMNNFGETDIDLWDDEDGFYYDVLHRPNGTHEFMKVRSVVGLIPLLAVEVLEEENYEGLPDFKQRIEWFVRNRPHLVQNVANLTMTGVAQRRLLSIVDPDRLRLILARMLDETEFLSPHGIRAVSRFHKDHPMAMNVGGVEYRLEYEPAESTTGLFGGNSNWRGPVWFPVNYLLIEALQKFDYYLGPEFKVAFPTGSETMLSLGEVAAELSRRLTRTFLQDEGGQRPVYGGTAKFQSDPHWRDLILFFEYFHGDNGAGIGASHQTGWTGLVAKLIEQSGE